MKHRHTAIRRIVLFIIFVFRICNTPVFTAGQERYPVVLFVVGELYAEACFNEQAAVPLCHRISSFQYPAPDIRFTGDGVSAVRFRECESRVSPDVYPVAPHPFQFLAFTVLAASQQAGGQQRVNQIVH